MFLHIQSLILHTSIYTRHNCLPSKTIAHPPLESWLWGLPVSSDISFPLQPTQFQDMDIRVIGQLVKVLLPKASAHTCHQIGVSGNQTKLSASCPWPGKVEGSEGRGKADRQRNKWDFRSWNCGKKGRQRWSCLQVGVIGDQDGDVLVIKVSLGMGLLANGKERSWLVPEDKTGLFIPEMVSQKLSPLPGDMPTSPPPIVWNGKLIGLSGRGVMSNYVML